MTEMTTYFCEICGDTFDNPTDCEQHEIICAVVEQIELRDLFILKNCLSVGQDINREMDCCEIKEIFETATQIHCKTREAYRICNQLLEFLGFEEMPLFKDSAFPVDFIWDDDYFYWKELAKPKPKPVVTTDLPSAVFHQTEWRERVSQWSTEDIFWLLRICAEELADRAEENE